MLGRHRNARECGEVGARGGGRRYPLPTGPADVMGRDRLQARARGFDEAAIAAFYVGVWNLFYSECVSSRLVPFPVPPSAHRGRLLPAP